MAETQLRPMGFGEILDTAFTLYRRHFSTFFLTALLPNLPVALFWLYVGSVSASADPEQVSALGSVVALLVLPYSLVAALLVWGGLIHGASRAFTGEPVSLGEGYRRALRRFFPLLGASVVALILIWLGSLLLVIPGILLGIMFFAVMQTVVIEEEGPISALGRSRELARGGWKRIFGILAITMIIVSMPSIALFSGAGVLGAMSPGAAEMMADGTLGGAFQAGSVLVSALTLPFMVTSLVVLYYDRRVRSEGLDLEMAAEQIRPAG